MSVPSVLRKQINTSSLHMIFSGRVQGGFRGRKKRTAVYSKGRENKAAESDYSGFSVNKKQTSGRVRATSSAGIE